MGLEAVFILVRGNYCFQLHVPVATNFYFVDGVGADDVGVVRDLRGRYHGDGFLERRFFFVEKRREDLTGEALGLVR